MSIISTASFVANAQTSVVWGRALTASEVSQLNSVRIAAVNAGRQCSTAQSTLDTDPTLTNWSDISDANAYVAVANTFSPAPTTPATATSV
jgi:hypothetical protein